MGKLYSVRNLARKAWSLPAYGLMPEWLQEKFGANERTTCYSSELLIAKPESIIEPSSAYGFNMFILAGYFFKINFPKARID